ncbi:NUDIX hydrolase [Clostridium polynesiense]|uniref:NUDIX hydrolase n=1 Tax=Clostridium polynesiense TaxID=1325933 RepID=UPI0005901B26|nr:NUDIX domain-containing protein [Clostridium polynesiense]
MVKINFYRLNEIEDNKIAFVVIMSRFKEKWIYVKHKNRCTWEIPGGHREDNESLEAAAARELFEETGAVKFKLNPLCVYAVQKEQALNYTESFGELFYAEIDELDKLPEYEIEKIDLLNDIPKELTYPLIQPFLHRKAEERIKIPLMDKKSME